MNQSDFDRLRRLHPSYVSGDDVTLSLEEALLLIEARIHDDNNPKCLYDHLCEAFRRATELPVPDSALGVISALCADADKDMVHTTWSDFCGAWARVLRVAAALTNDTPS